VFYVHGLCCWYIFILFLLLLFVFLTGRGLLVMFLLILCVEVPQSQGGFEVQSSQFMSLLFGAAPQIQDSGYQVSPNLFSEKSSLEHHVISAVQKRIMF